LSTEDVQALLKGQDPASVALQCGASTRFFRLPCSTGDFIRRWLHRQHRSLPDHSSHRGLRTGAHRPLRPTASTGTVRNTPPRNMPTPPQARHRRQFTQAAYPKVAQGLLLYFFWLSNKPNGRSRVIATGAPVFFEPRSSIGDFFPEKRQKRTMAIRHRCFHPERIRNASL